MKNLLFYLTAFAIAIIYSLAHSQDNIQEFGKIAVADLLMQECAFDKSADAMFLINTEDIRYESDAFTGNPKTITEYRVRIKIFKETSFRIASIVIPYSVKSHSTKITDIEAVIYNLDKSGNIVTEKLTNDQIYNAKSKANNSSNRVSFTFPGLKIGSVIEYRYSRVDKNYLFLQPWFFQEPVPVRFSKCIINLPYYANVSCHVTGTLPFDKDSSSKIYNHKIFSEYIRSFTMHNVPGFKTEPFMGDFRNIVQHLEFAVTPRGISNLSTNADVNWRIYNNMMLTDPVFGRQFDKPVDSTASFLESVMALKQRSAIIQAVYGFVKKHVAWNGEQLFYPANIDECWKDKTGSSAEMNILLLNLLRKAGIRCYPILVSTRDNGRVNKLFPSLGQFNGVDVIAIDSDRLYILDCTQKNLSYNAIPYNIVNRIGFIIDRDDSKWITVVDNHNSMQTSLNATAVMDSTGVIKGKGDMLYTGNAKIEKIKSTDKDKSKERYNSLVDDGSADLTIDSVTTQHANDDNDSLLHKVAFHSALANTGDDYFLNPFIFSMFKKNPFKDTTRYTDIDFGSNQTFITKILVAIPQNFSVDEVPKSIFIRMEDSAVMFKREILSSPSQVLIRNSFVINRPLFDKEEYSSLKSFFDKVYALMNELIVLKKKE